MKIKFWLMSIMALLIIPSIGLASAVLVEAKGNVSIKLSDGSTPKAAIGLELPDQTKVTIGQNSSALVMLSTGAVDKIGASSAYVVGAKEKKEVKNSIINGFAVAMKEAVSDSENAIAHGMVKMGRLGPGAPMPESGTQTLGMKIYYPKETALFYKPNLEFKWVEGGIDWDNPVLVIDDKDKKHIKVISLKKEMSKFSVSSSQLNLKKGEAYSWYLAQKNNEQIDGKTPRYNFSILSSAKQAELDRELAKINSLGLTEPSSKQFLKAQIYYNFKLYSDVVNLLLPIWEKEQTEGLRTFMFSAYQRMSINDEALKFAPPPRS